MSKNIVDIKVELLYPHPKNPRLDVGDVTELAESIKVKGILQNLTVVKGGAGVPEGKEGYTVIIGHRRRAGAIAAGVDTVPCAIVDMSETEQVSTMLLENMQRTDLTIYEQAQGIQAMMDLGETVKSISEKTGFSASTIDRRRKLLVLDKDKFKESQGKNVTFDDYLKIAEIKDEDARNKVLDSVGTNNFNWYLSDALDKQKKNEVREVILGLLPESVKVVKTYGELPNNRSLIMAFSLSCFPSEEKRAELKEKLAQDGEYFAYDDGYYNIYIYITVENSNDTQAASSQESEYVKKERERKANLDALCNKCKEMRKEFLENFKPTKQNADKVILFNILVRNVDGDYGFDVAEICKKLGFAFDEDDSEYEYIEKCAEENAVATLYWQAVYSLDDNLSAHHSWDGKYCENYEINMLYKGLAVLGYQISDEEKAYIDGSHILYEVTEEQDNED